MQIAIFVVFVAANLGWSFFLGNMPIFGTVVLVALILVILNKYGNTNRSEKEK